MTSNMVYDLIDPRELVQYVRAFENEVLRPEAALVLEEFLPNQLTEDLEFSIKRGAYQDQDAAEYRAWDTPAPMAARQGVQKLRGSLGPISRQIPLGEEEALRLRSLLSGTNDPVIDQIFADAENMIRAVQVRLELARADLIDDGKVTISENGLTLTADFGRSGAMSQTAANLWTDLTLGKPLSDLLAWQQSYEDQNGVTPGLILMPRVRLGSLALNKEMREFAASGGTTPTRLNNAQINDIFANEGLPPIRIYDGQFRRAGTRGRALPVEKIYFMPPAGQPLGNTFYGITAEALKLAQKGYITASEAPGVVAVVTETTHPVQTYTVGTAVALPAMPNPDLVMDLVVA